MFFGGALNKQGIPKNTAKDTSWSIKVYKDWQEHNNKDVSHHDFDKRVPDLSPGLSAEKLNFWLMHFVMEVNRRDGSPYPDVTLKHLCVGIQRYMRNVCGKAELSIFESPKFATLRQTLDAKMKHLNR